MHEYQHMSIDEDELLHQQPGLLLRRSLVVALYLSFFACLAALWFSGTLLDGANQILPSWLFQVIADHRLIVLAAPFACLVVCYGALRRLTSEIMAAPERYLDERQKAMRDQAHRSAFQIIKLSCLVIPALLLAQYLPWFHHSSTNANTSWVSTSWVVLQGANGPSQGGVSYFLRPGTIRPLTPHPALVQTTTTASSTEIAFAVAILLLCLLLLFSALPMSVLAWKGKA
jgi:hypothetical protein